MTNLDQIKDIAQRCGDKGVFLSQYPHLFRQARKQGILDSLFELEMENSEVFDPEALTLEQAKAIARTYPNRRSFSRRAKRTYLICRDRDWLDDVCAHMEGEHAFDADTAMEICGRFEHRYQLRRAHPDLDRWLSRAGRQKLAEACFAHMERPRGDFKKLKAWAKQFKTRTEFKTQSPTEWRQLFECITPEQRKDVLAHLPREVNSEPRTKDDIIEMAREFKDHLSFRRIYSALYARARKQGWLEEIFGDKPYQIDANGIKLDKPIKYLRGKEEILAIAEQYKDVAAFRYGYPQLYKRLSESGALEQLLKEKPYRLLEDGRVTELRTRKRSGRRAS